jgi:hypothetical protein
MAMSTKPNRRLTDELLATAQDMHASGLMSEVAHEKITLRHLDKGRAAEHSVNNGERPGAALPLGRKTS